MSLEQEEHGEGLLKDTIIEERAKLCDVVRRLGSKLSGLMLACGLLVTAFSIYLVSVPQDSILSIRVSLILTGAIAFVGGLNILCGLLLLLGED